MGVNFCEKLRNRIFAFLFHELGRYHFTKANFLTKFVKILCHENFRLYSISFTVIRLLCMCVLHRLLCGYFYTLKYAFIIYICVHAVEFPRHSKY